ncbi:restriction endonuclease [Nocardioidaceae bacterium]|nr:restriction endonuclease [Nocardioidaceae bacterium]
MFAEEGLEPRLSYRPKGEEIDGSIWFHGRTILVEAKWTGDPHPASSIYQFKGKVDGKLVGTLGLFISIGGFSSASVDALVAGKELNLILADGDDLRAIIDQKVTLVEALERKLRAAGDEGTPFLPLTAPVIAQTAAAGQHLVVVEGRSDVRFFESVRRVYMASRPVTFVPASGPMNMIPVTRLMLEVAESVATLTVVVDGDVEGPQADRLRADLDELVAEYEVSLDSVEVIVAQPDTEVALGLADPETPWRDRRHLRNVSDATLDALVADADLPGRAAANPTIARLLTSIGVRHE